MKKFIISLMLLAFAPTGFAAPVLFNYSGICDFGCDGLGLSEGDGVGGWISLEDADLGDGFIGASELTGWELIFGDLVFSSALPGHTVAGAIAVPPALADAQALRFAAPGFFGDAGYTGSIDIELFGFDIELTGWLTREGIHFSGGEGTYAAAAAVPEPGTLSLLGLGLLSLGWRRLRAGR